jgi:hypothetical protein
LAYDSNPVKKCIAMLSLAKFSTENIGWTGVWVIIFENGGAPTDFKAKFPTRIIVDGTECPIKQSKAPREQQATFSTYKNRNTVKILVRSTPGGLVNCVSDDMF